ncbi:hypothetical protein Tco_0541749, partial [Tanacetum coccineum]
SLGRSSYVRALIEVQADVELKHNIMVVMPKLVGDGFYTCTVRVEYEWKPTMLDSYTSDMCIQSLGRSSYVRALIEVQDDVELKHNIMVAMPKLVGDGFYTCTVRV